MSSLGNGTPCLHSGQLGGQQSRLRRGALQSSGFLLLPFWFRGLMPLDSSSGRCLCGPVTSSRELRSTQPPPPAALLRWQLMNKSGPGIRGCWSPAGLEQPCPFCPSPQAWDCSPPSRGLASPCQARGGAVHAAHKHCLLAWQPVSSLL